MGRTIIIWIGLDRQAGIDNFSKINEPGKNLKGKSEVFVSDREFKS